MPLINGCATAGSGSGGYIITNASAWVKWHQEKSWTLSSSNATSSVTSTTTWPTSWVADADTGTVSYPNGLTWVVWNGALQPAAPSRELVRAAYRDLRLPTPEEVAASNAESERVRAQMQAHHRAVQAEREAAKARARLLLRQSLTEQQKAELGDKRFFTLTKIDSETGERRHYRIHHGRAGNVEQVDEHGQRIARYCIHPKIDCPDEDTMLAQMLMLQACEPEFLRVANRS